MKTTLSFRINAIATAILLSLVIFCSGEEKTPETIFDNGGCNFSSFAEEHNDLVSDAVYDQAYAVEDVLYAEQNDSRLAQNR